MAPPCRGLELPRALSPPQARRRSAHARRPIVLPNEGFEKCLAEWGKEVSGERSGVYVPAKTQRLEDNEFEPVADEAGPYRLKLSLVEKRLIFAVSREDGTPVVTHMLSLTPLRKVVKDYFMICESYFEAIKTATPSQIEAIDMGRRGVHNEGSQILMDRLDGKIRVDMQTARRLFTLVCALHWKG